MKRHVNFNIATDDSGDFCDISCPGYKDKCCEFYGSGYLLVAPEYGPIRLEICKNAPQKLDFKIDEPQPNTAGEPERKEPWSVPQRPIVTHYQASNELYGYAGDIQKDDRHVRVTVTDDDCILFGDIYTMSVDALAGYADDYGYRECFDKWVKAKKAHQKQDDE